MKKSLFCILLMLLPILASADPVEVEGVWYNLIPKAQIAEVTKKPSGKYTGNVIILDKVIDNGVEYTVTKIAGDAFYYCTSLTSITIPNSVTSIANNAFYYCTSLTSVTIPNSVESIGNYAFSGCSGLTSVSISDGLTSIGAGTFYGCCSLTSITIPNSVTSIANNAFYSCTSLTSVTIPNSVESIGNYAFSGCSGLTSVSISDGLTSIGAGTFYGCCSLTSITIPNSVTSIGDAAFHDCNALTSVTIPNSVESIGDAAFYMCSGLTSVTIGNNVTFIGSSAFGKCELLADVYCLAEQVRENTSYGSQGLYTYPDAFVDSYQEFITLHVPAASIEAYKAIEPWKSFKEVVALNGEDIPVTPKCATPTISLVDGKITFSCETEGVEYISEVTVSDAKKYYDNEISAPKKFKVTVYAAKASYDNSDTATAEFDFSGDTSLSGDVDGNGIVNVADHVKLSDIIMNK